MSSLVTTKRPKARIPVLVFGHGITHLGVIRGLAAAGIPSYSISDEEDFTCFSRHYRALPGIGTGEVKSNRLAEFLARAPLETAVLMPCTDDWCRAIASLPAELAERFPASVPPRPIVEALLDKWLLAELLEREQIPHPRTLCLRTFQEAEALPEQAYVGGFLKPRASRDFSRRYQAKAFVAENRDQALRGLQKAFADGFSMVFQEYIPGPATEHYFVDGFVDRNGSASFLARQRLRANPPRFGNSCFTVSVPLRQVDSAVDSLERLLARTHFRGMFDAEFKHDARDGRFKLIEINCRPWWQLDFTEHCGFPICHMAYWDALGHDVEPVRHYQIGRRGVILSQDFQAYLALKKLGQMSFWSWVSSWIGAHDFVFRWSDPWPSVAQLWSRHKLPGQRCLQERSQVAA